MIRALVMVAAALALPAGLEAQAETGLNVLNANIASEAELLPLPHMTPALAKTILEGRPFKSIRDLDALLQPVSRQQRSELYGRLFVPMTGFESPASSRP